MGGSKRMMHKDYAAASCAVSESIAVSPSPACAAAWSFCCVCVQRNATRVVSKHSRHALQHLHTPHSSSCNTPHASKCRSYTPHHALPKRTYPPANMPANMAANMAAHPQLVRQDLSCLTAIAYGERAERHPHTHTTKHTRDTATRRDKE